MIINGRSFPQSHRPYVVGVVNLSPESPNQDSIADGLHAAAERAALLTEQGASMIDVGAQSSYFEAPLLPVDEEIARLTPVIRGLKQRGFTVSADTFRAEVAEAAIEAGADVINDSDGFQDPGMVEVLSRWRGPVILPFISGASPHDPQPFDFEHPLDDILPFLREAVERAHKTGLHDLLLDPGTGYRYPGVSPAAKERYQRKVYDALSRLREIGHPLLIALPRKDDHERTLELVRMILRHADFVRAHDPRVVAEAMAGSSAD